MATAYMGVFHGNKPCHYKDAITSSRRAPVYRCEEDGDADGQQEEVAEEEADEPEERQAPADELVVLLRSRQHVPRLKHTR